MPTPNASRKPRGFSLTKLVVGVVVVAAIGGGTYLAFGRSRETTNHSAAEIATASVSSFDIVLTANGELAAKKQTELRNELEMESSIAEIIDEGKTVPKDEVLVRLNSEELEKQLDAETLELTGATSEAVSAQKSYEIQEIENDAAMNKAKVTLELAQLELKKWQGENAAKLQELQLDLEAATKDHERADEKYEKAIALHERQFLSTDQLKQDEVTRIQAESKLKTATTALDVHKQFTQVKERRKIESDISEAIAEVERLIRKNESELSSKKAALDRAVAEKAQRERQVDKLKKQIEKTVIKAPTDGLVVYSSSIQPSWQWNNQGPMAIGRKVYPNETIIVLPDTSEMLAQIKVHESLVSRIKPGMKATVKIDAAQGRTFDGVVDSIGIMAQQQGGWMGDNVREYEVKIALILPPDAPPLKPSMRCEAQITTERVENTLSVPLTSVFNEGPRTIVYAVRGSKYERVGVKVGRRSDLMAEIKSGLDANEKVLLREPSPALVLADPNAGKPIEKDAAKPGTPVAPAASQPAATVAAAKPASTPAAEPAEADEPSAEDATEEGDPVPTEGAETETASAAPRT
ncbi:MAG: HlyD family efflux transporter periplasmic adaptor subunit [Phycisphaerales bacterium]